MAQTFSKIPNWTFEVHEVSMCVYKVTAKDMVGRTFEKTGLNPDTLLEEAKQYAMKVIADSEVERH